MLKSPNKEIVLLGASLMKKTPFYKKTKYDKMPYLVFSSYTIYFLINYEIPNCTESEFNYRLYLVEALELYYEDYQDIIKEYDE